MILFLKKTPLKIFHFPCKHSFGLNEAQGGIKIARRNINNLRYADDTTLLAESEEELNSLLMKVRVSVSSVQLLSRV